jgi:hypothetical protein
MRVHINALILGGAIVALSCLPGTAEAAGTFRCDASALRGTVLGATTIEPVTANRGQTVCRTATGGGANALPPPVAASALSAATTISGTPETQAGQTATAAGGLADIRVQLTPNILNNLPIEQLVANVPPLSVPLVGSVDLKPALREALTSATLDLLQIQAVQASARARCSNGRPVFDATSSVVGVKVLGQDTPVNGLVEQSVNVIGGGSINPSQLDISKLALPAGVTLDPVTTGLIRQALQTLPAIPIPPAVANIRLTPGEEIRTADGLTRRALHVELGLLGQSIVDLVVGEAVVGATADACSVPATVAQAALECTSRRLVLIDVFQRGNRVRLFGAADKKYIGRRVPIFFKGNGRKVASPRVRQDGTFRATAPLPNKTIRETSRARYEAKIGFNTSLPLKLRRRMIVRRATLASGRVRIVGFVRRPLASPPRTLVLKQRVSCSKTRVVARIKPTSSGRFTVTVRAPKRGQAGTYRLSTFVQRTARSPKLFPTFTLPIYVDLGRGA